MQLNQLRYFIKVAEVGGVNLAAEELHVTQPAVSTAIRKLEEELEVQLFSRYHQRMELTGAGETFYRRMKDILEKADEAVREVKAQGNRMTLLRVGIPPMIGMIYITPIIRLFRPANPEIKIRFIEANTRELSQMLQDKVIDVALMIGESPYSRDFERTMILKTKYHFYVGKDDPLSRKELIDMDDLVKEPLMLFDKGLFLNEYITNAFSRHKQHPNIVFAGSQIDSIKKYVSQSVGGTFLIQECVKADDGLIAVDTAITPTISIVMTWAKGTELSRDEMALLKFLKHRNTASSL